MFYNHRYIIDIVVVVVVVVTFVARPQNKPITLGTADLAPLRDQVMRKVGFLFLKQYDFVCFVCNYLIFIGVVG
jgi:hypothetical protein